MSEKRSPKVGISPTDLKDLLENPRDTSYLLLDVREPEEYEDWRIEESLNIPLGQLTRPASLRSLPRDTEIIAICAHGIRSAEAATFLKKKGFKAEHLAGGLSAWNKVHDIAPVILNNRDEVKLLQLRRVGKGCASYVIVHER